MAVFRETDLLEDRFESEMRLLKARAYIVFARLYSTLLARLLKARTPEHLLRICPLLLQAMTLDRILSEWVSDGTQNIHYHLSDLPWGKSSPGSQKKSVGCPARWVHHLSVPLSALCRTVSEVSRPPYTQSSKEFRSGGGVVPGLVSNTTDSRLATSRSGRCDRESLDSWVPDPNHRSSRHRLPVGTGISVFQRFAPHHHCRGSGPLFSREWCDRSAIYPAPQGRRTEDQAHHRCVVA